jgi:hypothetical protein
MVRSYLLPPTVVRSESFPSFQCKLSTQLNQHFEEMMGSSEGHASLISFCSDVPASLSLSLISFCFHPNPKPYPMITLTLTLILMPTLTLTKECADLILMHQIWRLQMCFDILGIITVTVTVTVTVREEVQNGSEKLIVRRRQRNFQAKFIFFLAWLFS